MLSNPVMLQTVTRELPADLETPISVYLKLRGSGPSFLLESVEGGENIARYSFIGVNPRRKYLLSPGRIRVEEAGLVRDISQSAGADPTRFLQAELEQFQNGTHPGLPRFVGGLAGYLGYESVRFFEPRLAPLLAPSSLPDGIFLLCDTVLAFDHVRRSLFLIGQVLDGDEQAVQRKLDRIEQSLRSPLPLPQIKNGARRDAGASNCTRGGFEQMVSAAREHIAAGDIFQVVLSQRFSRQSQADPFEIYRAVRRLNPSPYMFFFDFGLVEGQPFHLVGASPEMFVRLEGRTASLRPIAGTRRRGEDFQSDAALADELLADPKERAEHVMLVDLGRNDLGRVCEYGSVHVPEFFTIERYSHVMHLVSHVQGRLRPGLNAFDLVRAAFPAGTVSGAPKVRAMEIIAGLEQGGRGPYAGMVGYFGFDGALDTCLAIRTLVAHGETVSVQAGAGIVADSDPSSEYQETLNKAQAMLKAIETAENINRELHEF
jgi:anthranilate synthase component I